MIRITGHISIDESEIAETFIRASGPGGQNVNKVSSGVQLRFDLMNAPSLASELKARAAKLAGQKLSKAGVIVISATRFRTQEQNRADALKRLVELLAQAAIVPKRRKPTRPTLASRKRRMDSKTRRGATKKLRSEKPISD